MSMWLIKRCKTCSKLTNIMVKEPIFGWGEAKDCCKDGGCVLTDDFGNIFDDSGCYIDTDVINSNEEYERYYKMMRNIEKEIIGL